MPENIPPHTAMDRISALEAEVAEHAVQLRAMASALTRAFGYGWLRFGTTEHVKNEPLK